MAACRSQTASTQLRPRWRTRSRHRRPRAYQMQPIQRRSMQKEKFRRLLMASISVLSLALKTRRNIRHGRCKTKSPNPTTTTCRVFGKRPSKWTRAQLPRPTRTTGIFISPTSSSCRIIRCFLTSLFITTRKPCPIPRNGRAARFRLAVSRGHWLALMGKSSRRKLRGTPATHRSSPRAKYPLSLTA